MCNITLDEALVKFFPVLYKNNVIGDKAYYQKRADTYKWERTQKNPKDTCSWDCGQNYKAWRRTHEPKKSYYAESRNCDCCGHYSTRGRIIKQRRGKRVYDFHLCIACWRKKEIKEGRRLWEVLNRTHRNAYCRLWRKLQPDKSKLYKKRYKEKLKTGKPRLGNCRKPICSLHPSLSF